MQKNLLIVFAKNKIPGKVKTRLAQTIGDAAATDIYTYLYHLTERESQKVKASDLRIYFTHFLDEEAWQGGLKFMQTGDSLGDRMKQAFVDGFEAGYDKIIGIGADLPDLSAELIEKGFEALNQSDFVFGPALDGGYYLLGMKNEESLFIFEDKPWSTDQLLKITKAEIASKGKTFQELIVLNDIDTISDLKNATIYERFSHLIPTKQD